MEIDDKVIWDSGNGFEVGTIIKTPNDFKGSPLEKYTFCDHYHIDTNAGMLSVRDYEISLYTDELYEETKKKYAYSS